MPLIQNKKSKFEQVVDLDTWKLMEQKGLAGRYTILDDRDVQETVIKKPEIFEPVLTEYDDITKAELMEELSFKGVEFSSSATKKDLYELYIK
jgi:hypothetical protein